MARQPISSRDKKAKAKAKAKAEAKAKAQANAREAARLARGTNSSVARGGVNVTFNTPGLRTGTKDDKKIDENLQGTITSSGVVMRPGSVLEADILENLIRNKDGFGAQPLALFPLSLEYRFVTRKSKTLLRDTRVLRAEVAKAKAHKFTSQSQKAKLERAELKTKALEQFSNRPFDFVKPESLLKANEELWVRWYPDDGFAEDGVEELREDEKEALTTFLSNKGSAAWWDLTDETVLREWQAFTRAVGPYRAVHLVRNQKNVADGIGIERAGRIAALPNRIALFALKEKPPKSSPAIDAPIVQPYDLELIANGATIPANSAKTTSDVSYHPEAVDPGSWLTDFNVAVSQGMGVKITDPAAIKLAKDASWIIAVGLHGKDCVSELQGLLKSHIANGEFGVLPQGSPTNNTPNSRSYHTEPQSNLVTFTQRASAAERGDYIANTQHSADLLAEAFGLDVTLARQALDGNDMGQADARAMMRVIGPTLMDDLLDGKTSAKNISEDRFVEIMSASFSARGALPAVRFGSNAMGVLPMVKVHDYAMSEVEAESEAGQVLDVLHKHASYNRHIMPAFGEIRAQVMYPNDTGATDKFNEILATTRVSKRIDVVDSQGTSAYKPAALGCPYVEGRAIDQRSAQYLRALYTHPLKKLDDPTSSQKTWPLLYRLARLALTRNVSRLTLVDTLKASGVADRVAASHVDTIKDARLKRQVEGVQSRVSSLSAQQLMQLKQLQGVTADARKALSRRNETFVAALKHLETIALRPGGVSQLEVLLCEMIDFYQHRTDAFVTGLAHARLARNRQRGQKGLKGGYFGMLGKLRPDSETRKIDGYIQAPSVPQATTSAVLRSAYLRHKDGGAFKLDISSGRTREALKLLDLLGKGHGLADCLGFRGERWLHEEKLDRLILPLRAAFPIFSERSNSPAARRVFDGLAFMEATQKTPSKREKLRLQAYLRDSFDAMADIVLAEAVHQRALGRGGVANAWLQVLSGGTPPGRPKFLKTQRHGQGSTHKVGFFASINSLSASGANASARAIAEPLLARVAGHAMPNLNKAKLAFEMKPEVGSALQFELAVSADLGMDPIDLVIGGLSELQMRARSAIALQVQSNASIMAIAEAQDGGMSLSVDFDSGSPSLTTFLDIAARLRKTFQNARALEPTDLNQATGEEDDALDEAQRVSCAKLAVNELIQRCDLLADRMTAPLSTASSALNAANLLVRTALHRRDDPNANAASRLSAEQAANTAVMTLQTALKDLVGFGAPDALRPLSVLDALKDVDGFANRIGRLIENVTLKKDVLVGLAGTQTGGVSSLSEFLQLQDDLIRGLQGALDGDALPIFPIIPRNTINLRPKLNAPQSPGSVLQDWAKMRRRVSEALGFANLLPKLKAGSIKRQTTQVDPDETRPESVAPRSEIFAHYLALEADMTSKGHVSGVVFDEWTEQRPSETQMAGMAVNYDTPQSEAPNVIILGLPSSPNQVKWTELSAAEIVAETIQWMKARALSSNDRPAAVAFPNANQVSFKAAKGGKSSRRIPKYDLYSKYMDAVLDGAVAVEIVGDADLSVSAHTIVERGVPLTLYKGD